MDSREKQILMDEFGLTEPDGKTTTEPEQAAGEAELPEVVFEADEDLKGAEDPDMHESGHIATPEAEETTLTDGLVFDVIHEVGPNGGSDFLARIGEDPLAAELNDTKDRLLRLAAEFENFKKRRMREREDQQKYANERLLKDFLPVVDNLERALESARQTGQGQAIIAGLELVIHEFQSVLAREGVVPLDSVGKPFDPAMQDALQQIETTDVEPGMVAAEVLRGYLLHGRVLRAALVVVAREPQN